VQTAITDPNQFEIRVKSRPDPETKGSNRYLGTDIDDLDMPVNLETRIYSYDPIGKRTNITIACETGSYTTNSMNQYKS
jgi:hypothetical protein